MVYLSISAEYAQKIRQIRRDDFGHAVESRPAGTNGYGPCRCCLKQTQPGEERLLLSYAPVGADNPYNEVGPVFIHTHNCTPYAERHQFPPEVKAGRLPIKLVLRAYSAEKRMVDALQVVDNQRVEADLEQLFQNPAVEFVHVRNAEAQCFICEVRRN
jgi:hypothetical protein